jgi:indole-3-glycerol phosphate synthase
MTEDEKKAILASMYDQGDDEPETREQPEQLRLAGKATIMAHKGGTVALARVEYVEALEQTLRAQQKVIDEQNRRLHKMDLRLQSLTNIATSRLSSVESQVKSISENRWNR